jgi:hypothetical protein
MSLARPRALVSTTLSVLLPVLLVVVFAMHLRSLPQFLDFRLHYVPAPPNAVVRSMIGRGAQRPLLHDPHVIAYLALPLFLLTALMLHRQGRQRRPVASAMAFALTAVGTIYLGGLFGMWTSFYDGLAHVDVRYVEGATETFSALTSPRGAFLMTTTLAKLAFVGLALQALVMWGRDVRSRLGSVSIVVGCAMFLAFWDLDNWMLVGSVLLLLGLVAWRPDATPSPAERQA